MIWRTVWVRATQWSVQKSGCMTRASFFAQAPPTSISKRQPKYRAVRGRFLRCGRPCGLCRRSEPAHEQRAIRSAAMENGAFRTPDSGHFPLVLLGKKRAHIVPNPNPTESNSGNAYRRLFARSSDPPCSTLPCVICL